MGHVRRPPNQTTRKQPISLQATILSSLRKRNGGMVAGEGAPARWHLVGLDMKEAANSGGLTLSAGRH
jgi:hypothetical protein